MGALRPTRHHRPISLHTYRRNHDGQKEGAFVGFVAPSPAVRATHRHRPEKEGGGADGRRRSVPSGAAPTRGHLAAAGAGLAGRACPGNRRRVPERPLSGRSSEIATSETA